MLMSSTKPLSIGESLRMMLPYCCTVISRPLNLAVYGRIEKIVLERTCEIAVLRVSYPALRASCPAVTKDEVSVTVMLLMPVACSMMLLRTVDS